MSGTGAGITAATAGRQDLGGPGRLAVTWEWQGDALHVALWRGDASLSDHTCVLTAGAPECTFQMPDAPGGPARTVTFARIADDGHLTLWADVPLAENRYFRGRLVSWPNAGTGAPDAADEAAQAGPDAGLDAAPGPGPAAPPASAAGRRIDITNPAAADEAFRFLWIHGCPPARPADDPAFLVAPEDLPFVKTLARARLQDSPGAAMRQAAHDLRSGRGGHGDAWVPDVTALPDPVPALLALPCRLLDPPDPDAPPLDALADAVADTTGHDPGDLLDLSAVTRAVARVWQSLCAAALTPPAPGAAADWLTLLRVHAVVAGIAAERSHLADRAGRRRALGALPVLPEAAVPPAGNAPDAGWARPLGVGDVTVVAQATRGYAPGEVAATVSLMPGETRQDTAHDEAWHTEAATRADTADAVSETASEAGVDGRLDHDLQDTLQAVGVSRDYNKLNLDYGLHGVCGTLDGGWQGDDGTRARSLRRAATFARTITRRARERNGRRVAAARHAGAGHRVSTARTRHMDNSTGNAPVNGLYRWLDRHLHLVARRHGHRLVVEARVADPAAPVRERLETPQGPPPAPADKGITGPDAIDPSAWPPLAAAYDPPPEAPEPPRRTAVYTATVTHDTPDGRVDLPLPEGWPVRDVHLAWATSDGRQPLTGLVGPLPFRAGGDPGHGAGSGDGGGADGGSRDGGKGGDAAVQPFQHGVTGPPPARGHNSLKPGPLGDGAPGPVAVTVHGNGTAFAVTVTATVDHPRLDQALAVWRQHAWRALTAAHEAARARHIADRAARLDALRRRGERAVERDALGRGVMAVLAANRPDAGDGGDDDAPPPADRRFWEGALEWDAMTYTFHEAAPGPAVPEQPWSGAGTPRDGDSGLFDTFLAAGSARVLLPVAPGREAAVLFALAAGRPWRPDGTPPPVPPDGVAALTALADATEGDDGAVVAAWRETVPTALMVLEAGTAPGAHATPRTDGGES